MTDIQEGVVDSESMELPGWQETEVDTSAEKLKEEAEKKVNNIVKTISNLDWHETNLKFSTMSKDTDEKDMPYIESLNQFFNLIQETADVDRLDKTENLNTHITEIKQALLRLNVKNPESGETETEVETAPIEIPNMPEYKLHYVFRKSTDGKIEMQAVVKEFEGESSAENPKDFSKDTSYEYRSEFYPVIN